MSFANLPWYGWIIFVLTMCSFWSDIIIAGILVAHADKVKGQEGDRIPLGGGFFWTAIGLALTLHWMGG